MELSRTEDGEISSESDTSGFTNSSTPAAIARDDNTLEAATPRGDKASVTSGNRKKKHKSKKDLWKKMEQLEKLITSVTEQSKTRAKKSKPSTINSLFETSDSEESDSVHDNVSLHAQGRISENSDDDDIFITQREDLSQSQEHLSQKQKAGLIDVFGEDAVVQKEDKNEGLILDEAQVRVLKGSYRCTNPLFLSAFSEDNYDSFPIDQESEKWLEVPSLDSLVESCLVKRFGDKAAFSQKRGKSLFSQPAKMVEKIAYKGQQAARLGLVIQMYIQQSLANLLQGLQSPDFDKEKSVDMIKDIFAMSTKGLDQIGRAGAFHHIARRAVSMTDTALYAQPEHSEFSNLPLTSEGVFGAGLEPLLKSRKEKKKQVDELIPDTKKTYKRKLESPRRYDNKRPVLERVYENPGRTSSQSSGWNNFRIPRVSREYSRPYTQRARGRFGNYPRRTATSGRGRLAKTDEQ